jgi:hypothetical protein
MPSGGRSPTRAALDRSLVARSPHRAKYTKKDGKNKVLSFVNFYLAFSMQREYFPGRLACSRRYSPRQWAMHKVPGMRSYGIQLGLHFTGSPAAPVAASLFVGQSRITSLLSRRLQQEGVCQRSFQRVPIL